MTTNTRVTTPSESKSRGFGLLAWLLGVIGLGLGAGGFWLLESRTDLLGLVPLACGVAAVVACSLARNAAGAWRHVEGLMCPKCGAAYQVKHIREISFINKELVVGGQVRTRTTTAIITCPRCGRRSRLRKATVEPRGQGGRATQNSATGDKSSSQTP